MDRRRFLHNNLRNQDYEYGFPAEIGNKMCGLGTAYLSILEFL